MRSNGKGIYEKDIDCVSYVEIGKYKYDFRAIMKDGSEIKLKRKIGRYLLNTLEVNAGEREFKDLFKD